MPERNFTLKGTREIFHHIESAMNKMLKADLNLVEKSKTICQGTEKVLTLLAVLL